MTSLSVPVATETPKDMKTFFTIWVGQLISMLGSGLTQFALAVWIYDQTKQATPFAITVLLGSLPRPGDAALSERQHELLSEARTALDQASEHHDPLLIAEALRLARVSFDALLGRTATEDMLDALFGRFCIGK